MSTPQTLNPDTPATNDDQITYWNGAAGERWVAGQEELDRVLEPISAVALEAANARDGEKVLDIGSGCGTTTLALADKVGEKGKALGIDVSAPMVGRARTSAKASKSRAEFLLADASTHDFGADRFDLLFSRFGVMFFSEPYKAFTHLRRAMHPGGRVTFVCWRSLAENEWISLPMGIVARHIEIPKPADPTAPGPFAFADPTRVTAILEGSGYEDVRLEQVDLALPVGDPDAFGKAADFLLVAGPVSRFLAEAEAETRAQVKADMIDALQPHSGRKGIHLGSAAWLVTARA